MLLGIHLPSPIQRGSLRIVAPLLIGFIVGSNVLAAQSSGGVMRIFSALVFPEKETKMVSHVWKVG